MIRKKKQLIALLMSCGLDIWRGNVSAAVVGISSDATGHRAVGGGAF